MEPVVLFPVALLPSVGIFFRVLAELSENLSIGLKSII